MSTCKFRYLCACKSWYFRRVFLFSFSSPNKIGKGLCSQLHVLIKGNLDKMKVDFNQQNILTSPTKTLSLLLPNRLLIRNFSSFFLVLKIKMKTLKVVCRNLYGEGFPSLSSLHSQWLISSHVYLPYTRALPTLSHMPRIFSPSTNLQFS